MKRFIFVLPILLTLLFACSKDKHEQLSRTVTIEGNDYSVTAHVYHTPSDPERRADITFNADDWQATSFPIDQITDFEVVMFTIHNMTTYHSFTDYNISPTIFQGHIANLPDWPDGTDNLIDVFFSFNYNGEHYQLKYSTFVCNHW